MKNRQSLTHVFPDPSALQLNFYISKITDSMKNQYVLSSRTFKMYWHSVFAAHPNNFTIIEVCPFSL